MPKRSVGLPRMPRGATEGLLGGERIRLPMHKAFVECPDELWREFRAQLLQEGRLVQVELGVLVAKRVREAKRAKMVAERKRRANWAKEVADARREAGL